MKNISKQKRRELNFFKKKFKVEICNDCEEGVIYLTIENLTGKTVGNPIVSFEDKNFDEILKMFKELQPNNNYFKQQRLF